MVVEAGLSCSTSRAMDKENRRRTKFTGLTCSENIPAHCPQAALAAPATNHRPPWWGLLSRPEKKKVGG